MPKKRPPKTIWRQLRRTVWERDKGRCAGPYCTELPDWSLGLEDAQIDHIRPGIEADNSLGNLRTLCRRCHVLRADHYHRNMIAQALRDGVIPPDWRSLVWD